MAYILALQFHSHNFYADDAILNILCNRKLLPVEMHNFTVEGVTLPLGKGWRGGGGWR